MIALWFAGCAPILPVAEEPGDTAGMDTGETGVVDTGETGGDTAGTDTGETGDTGAETGDTDTGAPTDYIATSGATMIYLPAGTFSMGSGLGDPAGSYTDHDVTLSHDFYLAQTETTPGEWEADPANTSWTYSSLPDYPCTGTTADCPADTITWYEAAMYANWLSSEEGLTKCYRSDGTDLVSAYLAAPYSCPGYRLPTEAEWEYAARAGVDTTYSGSNTAASVAWVYENAYAVGAYAHESCSLATNAWGFCDMSGNVWELTNDWFDSAPGGYGDGGAAVDPAGPLPGSGEGEEGSFRVLRGCYWRNYESYATVAYRSTSTPAYGTAYVGFRLARSMVP